MSEANEAGVLKTDATRARVATSTFFENQLGENGETARLLSTKQAASYLGFSEQALRLKTFRREIPFLKVGARVFFTKELLESWLSSCVVLPKGDSRSHSS